MALGRQDDVMTIATRDPPARHRSIGALARRPIDQRGHRAMPEADDDAGMAG